MNHLSTLLILLTIAVFSATETLPAPLGTGFTYQGRLDMGGIPVNGAAHLRVSLWDDLAAGNQIGNTQALPNVPMANGIFVVMLNESGEFGPDAFNGEARWLQIEVCTDAICSATTVLSPRQAVTGAPYALGPWVRSASGNLSYMTGNVGIGTASPTRPLEIASGRMRLSSNQGDIEFTEIADLIAHATEPSPDGAQPAFRVHTGSGLSRALTVLNNGSVGIGTATPTSQLEIAAQDGLAITGYQPFMTMRDTNGGNARSVIQSVNGGTNVFTDSYLSGGNPSAFYRLDNNGNLGIGVANPGKKLSVDGDVEIGTGHGDYQHLRIGGGNSSGFLYGSFPHFADGVHFGYNYYADAAGANRIIHNDGGTSRITAGYGFVAIATQNPFAGEPVNRLVVESNGNVRLGANTQLYAPGAVENLRIIRGTVHGSSSTILAGSGFQFTRNGTGKYTITFNTPFPDLPTITATPHLAVYVRVLDTESITNSSVSLGIYLRDNGNYADGTFNFIVMGPR